MQVPQITCFSWNFFLKMQYISFVYFLCLVSKHTAHPFILEFKWERKQGVVDELPLVEK